MKYHRLILIIVMTIMLLGCTMNMDGVRHVNVVNENKTNVNDIVVLPLYISYYGITIGPDSHGPTVQSWVLTKPFRLNSGEDIMSKNIQSRCIFIEPLPIFIGSGKSVINWLFLKKGYTPNVVTREMVYGESPIVMTLSKNDNDKKCIDIVLSKKPDQAILKELFKSSHLTGNIEVKLDKYEIALLETNK